MPSIKIKNNGVWKEISGSSSTSGSIELDTSLQVSGMAAESKAVGDAVTNLNTLIGDKSVSEQINEAISEIPSWAKAATKPSYTPDEVGADASGSAATALNSAKSYTDSEISQWIGDKTVAEQISISANEITSSVQEQLNTKLDSNLAHLWRGSYTGSIDDNTLNGCYWINITGENPAVTGTFPTPDLQMPSGFNQYGFLIANARYQKLVKYSNNSLTAIWERYYTIGFVMIIAHYGQNLNHYFLEEVRNYL